jgi:hypothetical protein
MKDDRQQARQRLARRLMRTLTSEDEPLIITETGEVLDPQHDPHASLAPTLSYQTLVELRRREYDTLLRQRPDSRDPAWGEHTLREHAAYDRTLDGIAYRLDLGFLTGDNETVAHVIYEAMMRLPDEVREFAHEHVVFLSGTWGQAFRGADWSDKWIILLAPDLPEPDATGVVAHQIAHAWRNHGPEGRGYTAVEEREACDLARAWGFSGSGTAFTTLEGPETVTYYIN